MLAGRCLAELTHVKAAAKSIMHLAGLNNRRPAMEWERIRKRPEDYVGANLQAYEGYAKQFVWAQARALLDGLPGGGLNIAHEAVDRHVLAGRGDKLALRWIGRDDSIRDFSYAALRAAGEPLCQCFGAARHRARATGFLRFSGAVPELYIAALGTLKNGSVFSPLFSAFGPEPVKARMTIGNAKALVTTEAFYRRKIEPWRKELASLEHVFLTECSANPPPGTIDLTAALGASVGFVRDRVDESRRHGAAALHQRHHRKAEGRRACARSRRRASYHRPARARPASGRYLLVHRRSRMGDRDLVWDHIAADERRDNDRRPGRVRRRTVVSHSARPESHGLVHGADRHPHADESRRRVRQTVRPVEIASHGERRRAAQSGGRGVGRRSLRQAFPRQLVADRDRRHHDLQLSCRWT